MANLNAEQAYVLSLLKEISNLNNQLENMELERNCAASHVDEFQLENKKLREKFNALKSYADDFKAENKTQRVESFNAIQALSAENKALKAEAQAQQHEIETLHAHGM